MRKRVLVIVASLFLFLLIYFTPKSGYAACTDVPTGTPNIFQIDSTKDSAVLHFVPATGTITHYNLVYGYDVGDERFGATIALGTSTGALTYTLNSLTGGSKYAFRLQAINDCGSGQWSDWKTTTTKGTSGVSKLPNTGPEKVLPFVFIVSGAFILLSFVF